jgi:hypothetical protein
MSLSRCYPVIGALLIALMLPSPSRAERKSGGPNFTPLPAARVELSWPADSAFRDFVWDDAVQGLKKKDGAGFEFKGRTCPGNTQVSPLDTTNCSVTPILPVAAPNPITAPPAKPKDVVNDAPAGFYHEIGSDFYCLIGSPTTEKGCQNASRALKPTPGGGMAPKRTVPVTGKPDAANTTVDRSPKLAQMGPRMPGGQVQCPPPGLPGNTVKCGAGCCPSGNGCSTDGFCLQCPGGTSYCQSTGQCLPPGMNCCPSTCPYGCDPQNTSKCLPCPKPWKYCNGSCIPEAEQCCQPGQLKCGGSCCGDSKYTCCTSPTGGSFCPDSSNSCDKYCPDGKPKCGGNNGMCCGQGESCYGNDKAVFCCTPDRACGSSCCAAGSTCQDGKCYACQSQNKCGNACCWGATPNCNNGKCQMCGVKETECPGHPGQANICCPENYGCGYYGGCDFKCAAGKTACTWFEKKSCCDAGQSCVAGECKPPCGKGPACQPNETCCVDKASGKGTCYRSPYWCNQIKCGDFATCNGDTEKCCDGPQGKQCVSLQQACPGGPTQPMPTTQPIPTTQPAPTTTIPTGPGGIIKPLPTY